MEYFLSDDDRMVQRAARSVNYCAEYKSEWIYPFYKRLVKKLTNPPHDALKRNTLRMFEFMDIPEKHMGELADLCFKFLDSATEPVAVRVFAMSVLLKIVLVYPELKDELKVMIEDHMPYGSAGFKSRGRKILKELNKIK